MFRGTVNKQLLLVWGDVIRTQNPAPTEGSEERNIRTQVRGEVFALCKSV